MSSPTLLRPARGRVAVAAASAGALVVAGLAFAPQVSAAPETSFPVKGALTPSIEDDATSGTPTLPGRLRPGTSLEPQPGVTPDEALADANDVLTGKATGDPSRVLNEATQVLANTPDSALSPSERTQAKRLFARPTDKSSPIDLFTYGNATTDQLCGADVCVRFATSGKHTATRAWAQTTLDTFEDTWAKEVDDLGFRAPLGDGTKGGNAKLDVYIGNIDADGTYGYAVADTFNSRTSSAYLVVDNDYKAFPKRTPLQNLQVTVAHEFMHAVQYGYDQLDDPWFMEATATWVEDEVYDGINDNRQYLSSASARQPGISLDLWSNLTPYGQWLFFRYITERWGVGMVKNIWEQAAKRDVYSLTAIDKALRPKGATMRGTFSDWSIRNNMPDLYEEGSAYSPANIRKTYFMNTKRTKATEQIRLNHLAARNFKIRPGKGMGKGAQLRVEMRGPWYITDMGWIITETDGTRRYGKTKLNKKGDGVRWMNFNRSEIRKINIVPINNSISMDCNQGSFSCSGYPLHDSKLFTIKMKAVR